MVSELRLCWFVSPRGVVLILVLMADGLWGDQTADHHLKKWKGLIVVLMADGLWDHKQVGGRLRHHVLIRVLMADGLWVWDWTREVYNEDRLNPCSNGRWSLSSDQVCNNCRCWSLNPCSNGRWSLRHTTISPSGKSKCVLILVLMADGLWGWSIMYDGSRLTSLNPCSNGRWSLRHSLTG